MGEGLGLDAAMQGLQVGGGGSGDGENYLGVAAVADDAAPCRIDAVIAADFAGQGVDEGRGLEDGGALVCAAADDDVAGPVGGGQPGQHPAQARKGDKHAAASD